MSSDIVKRIIQGHSTTDGAGVSLNRIIGSAEVNNIDPFFLLDEFRSESASDYIAGFPMHPHRGIETITYLLQGRFQHRDSRGKGGLLEPGDVQWMTAGKGIQHEEMPMMKDGLLWGYQLWLNLPKKLKWMEPGYQHLKSGSLSLYEGEGIRIILISGEYRGIKGPAQNQVSCEYYDVRLTGTQNISLPLYENHNAFIYIHTGQVKTGNLTVEAGSLVEFNPKGAAVLEGGADESGFLFLSARPHNEPYARGGPFVMSTREEVQQAFDDYHQGRLI